MTNDVNINETEKESKITGYIRLITVFIVFISMIVIVYILAALKVILIPVTVAIMLTLLFHPIVVYMSRRNIPKWASIVLIILGISAAYYLLILLLLPELFQIPVRASDYIQRIYLSIQNFASALNINISRLDIIKDINFKRLNSSSFLDGILTFGMDSTMFTTFYTLLGDLLITLLFFIFMISGKTLFELKIQKAFSEKRGEIYNTIKTIDEQIQHYILNEFLIGVIYGILVSGSFFLLGIEFAVTFGFIAFILNFIPKIGLIISAVLPLLFVFLVYGISFKFFLLLIIFTLSVFVITRYIEPKFIYSLINLSPVFVIFSIIFWGWIWGIAGFFLAFPIAAVMKILFSNIKPLKPLAIIIGSRVNLYKDSLLSG